MAGHKYNPAVEGSPTVLDGIGAEARFQIPRGIATDGTNLYVGDADRFIRKIVIATGEVTTIAGSTIGTTDGPLADATFSYSWSFAVRGTDLFAVEAAGTIRKIDLAGGTVTTVAGTPSHEYSEVSVDGTGAAARFCAPQGIATDGTNLYVADTRAATIRKVVIATGVVTTLAGTPGSTGGTDGTGTGALFFRPRGITTDGTNLYATSGHAIRKIGIATHAVTTLAGDTMAWGSEDGTGTAARFIGPAGVTTDGANLYVADGNRTIRKIVIATGEVTTLAGIALADGSADGIGPAAQFRNPVGITTDGTNLYVGDGSAIRKIVIATREVTTIAGRSNTPGSTDGPAANARFMGSDALVTDGTNLFVLDTPSNTIRKIVLATGMVSTLAGSPGNPGSSDGIGAAARFQHPEGITMDGTNLYVSDSWNNSIRKVAIATGEVTTLAGSAGGGSWGDGTGAAAGFSTPFGLTTDGNRLFLADYNSNTIRSIR